MRFPEISREIETIERYIPVKLHDLLFVYPKKYRNQRANQQ